MLIPAGRCRASFFQSKRAVSRLRPEGLRGVLPYVFWGRSRLEGIVDFGEGPFLKKCPSRSFFRFRSEGKRELQAAAGAGFRPDPPAVALDDVLADGKAEPVEAGLLRCFSTL